MPSDAEPHPSRAGLRKRATVGLLLALSVAGCGPETRSTGQPSPARAFSADVHHVVLEVDYASNAEPYTGPAGLLREGLEVHPPHTPGPAWSRQDNVLPQPTGGRGEHRGTEGPH